MALHARSMDVCIVQHAGAVLGPRHRKAAPAPVLQALAPDRAGLVVAVACLLPCSWLADLGGQAGSACVLGQALSMQAMQGGTAKNAHMAAHKLAVLLRGGLRPPAYGSPAPLRAPRAL
jgi:hypothetical protein